MAGLIQTPWLKCPRGEFERLGSRLRLRRQLRFTAAVASVMLAAGAVVIGSLQIVSAYESGLLSWGSNTEACCPDAELDHIFARPPIDEGQP